ncbi:44272_t:CDS:2 [Gigaspora margarita]|uniref:44272_t:CDS:1 n=1 Tax=Gigaspora margarita TaxID=4874 RepID=A0ABN7UUW5_GIGMA|nr:44272_t:CDS:2 [Gigaspora margarita]
MKYLLSEGESVYANTLYPISDSFLSVLISHEDGAAASPEIKEKNYRGKYFKPFGNESVQSSHAQDSN